MSAKQVLSRPQPHRSLLEATAGVLKLGKEKEINEVYLTRALNAITHSVEHTPLINPSAASSDYEVLLRVLEAPESLSLLLRDDPLASARLRGLKAKQQLVEANGGCIKTEAVAEILGISRQAVDKRRSAGKLIGLSRGKHAYLYPIWQFKERSLIEGLEQILVELQDYDPWMQVVFMLEPSLRLEGKTPLEALNSKQLDRVLSAARAFGEHGAD
jgi:hypothetical protein